MSCTRKRRLKKATISIIGLDGSGKSCVFNTLKKEPEEETAPTLGFGMDVCKVKGCVVTVFDLGGAGKIREIWGRYYAEIHGAIFVVDSSDTERLQEVKELFHKVRNHEFLRSKPILILCNKQDSTDALSVEEICKRCEFEERDELHIVPCVAQSSKLDSRIVQGLKWQLEFATRHIEALEEKIEKDTLIQKEIERKEREEKRERIRKRKEAELDEKTNIGGISEEPPNVTEQEQNQTNVPLNSRRNMESSPDQRQPRHRKKKGRTKRNQIVPIATPT
eukprot:m.31231 g.31231  ORF g.31231 m.31231 type:complete len:278 (+) comp8294_c0_seq1:58-891(+)